MKLSFPNAPGRQTLAISILVMLAAALIVSRPLMAQADDAGRQQVDEILYRHSDISPDSAALGMQTYQQACAACHDTGIGRAPLAMSLGNLAPETILRAVTSGQMKVQAAALSQDEKEAVSQFLTGRKLGYMQAAAPLMCPADPDWFDYAQTPDFAGWGLDEVNGHSIPGELAGITRENAGNLKLKWAFAFPGALHSRSQPTFAGGALFVGGDDGAVYAIDPESGCVHWQFPAAGPVRMGIVVDDWKAADANAKPLLYFGDLFGNAYAIDAATGEQVWRRPMDEHPNATLTRSPALHNGTLYLPVSSLEEPAAAMPTYECCTFRGSVVALDSQTGDERWRTYVVGEPQKTGLNANGVQNHGPSGVAIWSAPMVDPARSQLYVVTGDNYSSPATELSDAIVAVDLNSGKINWAYQALGGDAWNVSCGWVESGNCPEEDGPDYDFGAAPVLAQDADGRDYLLAGQKSGGLYAVDPDTGALRWSKRVGRGGTFGGIHFGIAALGGKVFAPVADFADGGEYDIAARPGVYALDISSGDYVWSAPAPDICEGKRFCQPGYGAAISVTPELDLAGSIDGRLRILDAQDGKMLAEIDTDREFTTVNGSAAHGGSISGGPAPIARHGMLFVNSGYGGLGKMPGNVLLAYSVK